MASRKELAHLKGRKPEDVGIKVVQRRGLAANARNEMSREVCDVKIGKLKLLGAAGATGT